MDVASIGVIVTSLLAIAGAVFGVKFKRGKDEVTELALDVIQSVQDDTVTEDECQKTAADAKALLKQ
jgi:hypothetical protein